MEDKYALLIDADNVSAKYIKPILDELSKYGNVTYKRIYGDWTSTYNSSWKEELAREFHYSDPAVQLYAREKCNRFRDDYRCDGYAVYKRAGRVLPGIQ